MTELFTVPTCPHCYEISMATLMFNIRLPFGEKIEFIHFGKGDMRDDLFGEKALLPFTSLTHPIKTKNINSSTTYGRIGVYGCFSLDYQLDFLNEYYYEE